jgi:F-type H+-transporting ATPase subunit b
MTEAANSYEAISVWSQVIGASLFLILLILGFRKYLMPAVVAAEKAKNAEIAETESRRDKAKTDVSTARGELEAADADANAIRARGRTDAQREHEKIVADAKSDGERIVRNAEGELDRARGNAKEAFRAEMIERALQMARKAADARIDAATNTQIVNATVTTLEREGTHG